MEYWTVLNNFGDESAATGEICWQLVDGPGPAPAPAPAAQCCWGTSCEALWGTSSCTAADAWCSASRENCDACTGMYCEAGSETPAPTPPLGSPTVAPTGPLGTPSPTGTAGPLSKVRFVGRWYDRGSFKAHSWGTGTFQFKVRGTTLIGVIIDNPLELYYVCRVNDANEVRMQHTSGTMTIATGLSTLEEYMVSCGRSDEASYGESVLKDIFVDPGASLVELPAFPSTTLRYEAIGDSITAGFKVYLPPGSLVSPSPENEDVFQTYERHLADAWRTEDWRVEARSGISVTPYSSEKVMAEQWPCRSFAWNACPMAWDFAQWQADVVTINLGTNDYVYGDPKAQEFESDYLALVELVRSKYPQALIFCIAPLAYSCFGGEQKWQTMVAGVAAAVKTLQDGGDSRVRYVSTGSPGAPWLNCALEYSDYTHPTVQGNRAFADRLLESLTPEIRSVFPEKCGGTGITCEDATSRPTSAPTQAATPTPAPTDAPATEAPTSAPTTAPTAVPTTGEPTLAPTSPTAAPTVAPTPAPTATPTAAPETPAPTLAPTPPTAIPTVDPTAAPTATPTAAPTAVEPTAVPTATPTAAEPTVAPTQAGVTPAPTPDAQCSALWAQCGGQGWSGPTCCDERLTCSVISIWYSQCIPEDSPSTPSPSVPVGQCSNLWEQCGGEAWKGPQCCDAGLQCQYVGQWYSQCIPGEPETTAPTTAPTSSPASPTPRPTTPEPTPAPPSPTTPAPTASPTAAPTSAATTPSPSAAPTPVVVPSTCVEQSVLECVNYYSTYWPKCDPSQSKTNRGPSGYEFGYYCDAEWTAQLNAVLSDPVVGKCDNFTVISELLAQVAYETGYYSTAYQPLDGGAGLIHMIPANWPINAADMDVLWPGNDYAGKVASMGKDFFQTPEYGWRSVAAWYLRTNRVIPGCGLNLFEFSYETQTRCILGRVVDRQEALRVVEGCSDGSGAGTAPPAAEPNATSPSPSGCAPLWAQCGGAAWTGPTCCPDGATCQVQNEWYSQCVLARRLRGADRASDEAILV
eukprot:TRINITY_DN31243_c0_g1_i1.p1 TRINITY_DN31243_c0_g1~~TRINITY_DN31243_c0_g1_i1.p1  ORF type:complete len:1186 (-),score=176.85 TRINITY_DN31243_c0_g1_i1:366-3452(-)